MSGFTATRTRSVQDARKRLEKFLKTVDKVPRELLDVYAEKIYNNAVAETPYKTGKLENAVYVRPSKSKTRVMLVAGASARHKGYNYAGIQHENESYNHPIKGKAHYISDPFNEGTNQMEKELREKVKY